MFGEAGLRGSAADGYETQLAANRATATSARSSSSVIARLATDKAL
jgi:hypothetical protein